MAGSRLLLTGIKVQARRQLPQEPATSSLCCPAKVLDMQCNAPPAQRFGSISAIPSPRTGPSAVELLQRSPQHVQAQSCPAHALHMHSRPCSALKHGPSKDTPASLSELVPLPRPRAPHAAPPTWISQDQPGPTCSRNETTMGFQCCIFLSPLATFFG